MLKSRNVLSKLYSWSKKNVMFFLLLFCALFMIIDSPIKAKADIASGTCGTCSWVISDDGTLTISPTDGVSGTLASYMNGNTENGPFHSWSSSIKKVVVEPGVSTGTGCVHLFYSLSNCTEMDLSNLDTSNATNMARMFENCTKLTSLDLSGFNTSNVTNMNGMFAICSYLTDIDLSSFDTSNVTGMNSMFHECVRLATIDVSGFDTRNVTNMGYMFDECHSLTSIAVSGFDTSKVTNMQQMFNKCSKLTSLDVSGFDTSNVTNMYQMFSDCSSLSSLDVSGFRTSNVTTIKGMFYNCSNLTSLDVSGWDTANVTEMWQIFAKCSKITSLDVSGFTTNNVTDMNMVFSGCSGLTSLDVAGWNTDLVTNMASMFSSCSGLKSLNLSGFNTSNVTNMSYMLYNCSGLESINLGESFKFNGKNITRTAYKAILPTPPSDTTTGKWVREDRAYGPYTPEELRDNYNGASMAGEWVWDEIPTKYTINFIANGGFGTMPSVKAAAAADYTLPDCTFVNYGKVFDHWEDENANHYNNGSTIAANTFEIGDVVTLTAVYRPKYENLSLAGGETSFSLYAGEKIQFHDIPANTSYEVWEETPSGWELVGFVNSAGVITPLENTQAVATNKYTPGTAAATFTAIKLVDNQVPGDARYTFQLIEDGEVIQEVQNDEFGYVQFETITYDAAGSFRYTIKEVNPNDSTMDYDYHTEAVFVEVTDNGQGGLNAEVRYDRGTPTFNNKHKPGTLRISKYAEPGSLNSTNSDDEFTFEITFYNENGAPLEDEIYYYYQTAPTRPSGN